MKNKLKRKLKCDLVVESFLSMFGVIRAKKKSLVNLRTGVW